MIKHGFGSSGAANGTPLHFTVLIMEMKVIILKYIKKTLENETAAQV